MLVLIFAGQMDSGPARVAGHTPGKSVQEHMPGIVAYNNNAAVSLVARELSFSEFILQFLGRCTMQISACVLYSI